MGNPSKTILLLFLLLLIVIVFFALTGLDLRKPEQSAIKMIDQISRLNRIINNWIRGVVLDIRIWFQELFTR